MAADTKVLAFGVVVGLLIIIITYHLTVPSSALLRPTLPFLRPPPPPTFQDMFLVQTNIRTINNNSNGSQLSGADSNSILLTLRKERRNFIRYARDHNVDLTSSFFQLFPPVFTCPYSEGRVGERWHSKWACGIRELYGVNKSDSKSPSFFPNCVVYSFGVGPEVAFEEAILKITNCKVFAYDHTVEKGIPSKSSLTKDPRRMAYQKIGVEEYHKYNHTYLKTIKQLMDINGHDWIDILKVDAEGAEYGSLSMLMDDFEDEGILPFDQFLVEIHNNEFEVYGQIIPWFNRLEAMGLRAIHAERNPVCNCFEYNFVNVRGRVFRNSTFSFSKNGWSDMRQAVGLPNVPSPFSKI